MIALYAAYFMLVFKSYDWRLVVLPYNDKAQCEAVAATMKDRRGVAYAYCIEGNKP